MSKKHRGHAKGDPVTYQTPLPAGGVQMETFLPWTLVRRGLKKQVITPLDAPQQFGLFTPASAALDALAAIEVEFTELAKKDGKLQ